MTLAKSASETMRIQATPSDAAQKRSSMKVRTSAISNQALGPTMVVVHCNPNSLSRYCGHLIFVYLLLLLLLLVLLFPLVLLSEMHYRSPRHRHPRYRRRRRSMVRLWLELGVINLSQHYHYLPTTYLSLHCLPSNHHALNEPVPHLTQLHKTQQPPNHSQPAINPTHSFTHPCNHFPYPSSSLSCYLRVSIGAPGCTIGSAITPSLP